MATGFSMARCLSMVQVASNRESVVRVVSKHVSRNVVSYSRALVTGHHGSRLKNPRSARMCQWCLFLVVVKKMVPITLKHPTCCREVCDAVVELDSSMNIAEDVHRLGAWLAHGRP